MKTILLIISILISNQVYSQDGSDIQYLKRNEITENLIGKFVHIDFYNRSFRAKKIDTIELKINNKNIKFIEVRKDNGFNNWFSGQSLISEDKSLQIEKFQVRKIENDKIFVTAFIKNLNVENSQNIEMQSLIIEKNKIAEILINAKQKEETITFNYNAIACTCAQWSELNKKNNEKEYFYLESINKNIKRRFKTLEWK